jgi:hypothetical protein
VLWPVGNYGRETSLLPVLSSPRGLASWRNVRVALALSETTGVYYVIGLAEIRDIAMALPQVEEGPPIKAARRIAGFKVAGTFLD